MAFSPPSTGDVEIVDEDDEVLDFYRASPQHTLKTLVCRAYWPAKKSYIALVITGDRTANFEFVKRSLGLKNIRLANPDEMAKLGLVVGYVSPMDCAAVDISIYLDAAVAEGVGFFDGANTLKRYRKNVVYPRDFSAADVLPFGK